MNFHISKIKLWFNKENESRIFEFLSNKVNIITGDSSTGKSSILKIIDYCLLDDRCSIVQDVINENIDWYGLVFYINAIPYTIIRKAPTLEQAEMCVIFREGEHLPDIPMPGDHDLRSNVMVKMNNLFNIPSKLKLDSKVKLNFRHNLIFNYLTEGIISTENTYQDLRFFRSREYTVILDDLFKMAIGVNELTVRELASKLLDAEHKAKRKRNAQIKEQDIEEKYNKNRESVINELSELGVYDFANINQDPEEWTQIMHNVIEAYNIQFRDSESNEKRIKLEKEIKILEEDYGYFISLQNEYKSYMKRLERQNKSLVPIEYMQKHMQEVFRYQETSLLLDKLQTAWTEIKESYISDPKLPENFQRRMVNLKAELDEKRIEYRNLNPLASNSHDIKWIRDVILLSERIEKQLIKTPVFKITESDILSLDEDVTSIDVELTKLRSRNDKAISNLDDYIKKYFIFQKGISESYSDCSPTYSMEEHMIMLDRDGADYPIANVGSQSNYMFLHLCYFFGLHELLVNNKNKHIPQFLFIDQPSVPYYADSENEKGLIVKSDDKEKLRYAFELIDKFMQNVTKEGDFQIIMIEHAGPNYWEGDNKLETFETRYQFTQGDGLIPNNIIQK